MAAHHQQAILLARLMLDGRPSQLQWLSNNIVQAQLYELGEMHGWLKLWGEPLVVDPLPMDWMLLGDRPLSPALSQYLIDCKTAPGGMPGLATREQIEQLRELDGEERDVHFLRLMLAHHQGGIPMAGFAADQASLLVVRQLATSVVLDQTEEIRRIHLALGVMQAANEAGR